jgi:hypothetical protein
LIAFRARAATIAECGGFTTMSSGSGAAER